MTTFIAAVLAGFGLATVYACAEEWWFDRRCRRAAQHPSAEMPADHPGWERLLSAVEHEHPTLTEAEAMWNAHVTAALEASLIDDEWAAMNGGAR